MNWNALDTVAAEGFAAQMAVMDKPAPAPIATGFWAIDWNVVEPLDDDEKCIDENPDFLYIPF